MKNKLELSLLIGLTMMLLFCAAMPQRTMQWWSAAFSPLCDSVLTADLSGGDIILKSKLCELITRLIR